MAGKPTNKDPEDIKAAVRKTGISLAELARRHELAPSTGRRALYEPCPRMNRVIAERLETTVHALWPEWFDADGARILRFERKSIPPAPVGHRQKEMAS